MVLLREISGALFIVTNPPVQVTLICGGNGGMPSKKAPSLGGLNLKSYSVLSLVLCKMSVESQPIL